MATSKELKSDLTAEWLREQMAYEPVTGTFMWKVRGPGRTVGKVLGTVAGGGYLTIKVQNILYYAHRLAWLYVHGEWPSASLDHIDGNRMNNAVANLRIATAAQNSARVRTKRSIAPSRGVFPHGVGFVARIHHAGKRHYLGYFPTAEGAKAAYEAKALELHGEFRHVEPVTPKCPPDAKNPNRDWLMVATPGFGG